MPISIKIINRASTQRPISIEFLCGWAELSDTLNMNEMPR